MAAIKITGSNFEQEIESNSGVSLIDFGATWCGPCKMLAPVIEELSVEYAGKIKIGKLDIDEELELARKFKVLSVPTLVLFKGGQEVDRIVGFQGKAQLEKWMNSK